LGSHRVDLNPRYHRQRESRSARIMNVNCLSFFRNEHLRNAVKLQHDISRAHTSRVEVLKSYHVTIHKFCHNTVFERRALEFIDDCRLDRHETRFHKLSRFSLLD
jgi:hypothetical protein